jgi:hypothetical protein
VESLAGLSLDFIDDPGIIRDVSIPDHIKKVASSTRAITSRDFDTMSESDFGVVFLTKHGHHIPKYPIHDKFHTWAAIVAFDKTAMKLPPAARSIAATFIKRACELHGVDYPEYMNSIVDDNAWNNIYDIGNPPKLASHLLDAIEEAMLDNMTPAQRVAFRDKQDLSSDPGRVIDHKSLDAVLSIPGGPREAANQDSLEAVFDTSMNPHAALDAQQQMLLELQGTKTAADIRSIRTIARRGIPIVVGAGLTVAGAKAYDESMEELNRARLIEEYEKQVNIGLGKQASSILSNNPDGVIKQRMIEKHAHQFPDSDFALVVNGERHYPLYTPELVKQASSFFEENQELMSPEYRSQFARKLAAKNREENMHDKYCGEGYGNQLESQLHMRKQCLADKVAHIVLDVLYEKRASMSPENFAQNLERFDRENGLDGQWDRLIYDPYSATFSEKRANLDYFYEQDGMSVTGQELRKLAEDSSALRGMFDQEIVDEFENDPVAIFSSMPNPQKSIMMKAAKSGGEKVTYGPMDHLKKKRIAKHANAAGTVARSESPIVSLGGTTRRQTPRDLAIEKGESGEAQNPGWLQSHYQNTHRSLAKDHYELIAPSMKKLTGGAKTPDEYKKKLEIYEHARNLALEEADRLASRDAETKIMRGLTKSGSGDFTAPKIDHTAGQKPLFGGKNPATTPVIPMGPNVSGVKTPGPRIDEASSKMAASALINAHNSRRE